MRLKSLPARTRLSVSLTIQVVRVEPHRTVVALRGEADVTTTGVLSDALSRIIASRAGDVVIDLGQLAFIDSASVRVLATAHHLLAGQGRTMTVSSPSRLGRRVLDLFGLTDAIEEVEVMT
jgi:anti-anti-sigma factor